MMTIPYGYRIEDERAIPDEVDAERVKNLYTEFVACGSMRAAAKTAGIEKTHSMVGRILKNETYLGTEFYPQLIDTELFQKAQEVREENAAKQGRIRERKQEAPATLCSMFTVGRVERKFEDPYEQARYAYAQIKEETA